MSDEAPSEGLKSYKPPSGGLWREGTPSVVTTFQQLGLMVVGKGGSICYASVFRQCTGRPVPASGAQMHNYISITKCRYLTSTEENIKPLGVFSMRLLSASCIQCCGSGSGRIRLIFPDPNFLSRILIRIRHTGTTLEILIKSTCTNDVQVRFIWSFEVQ